MNYKYYITILFFIDFFSLHASDTLTKRSSVKEIKVAYAEKTGNPYLIQKQRQQLIDHTNHEQFKKDIKIIQEWNDQEDGNSAGGAVYRIAENIETFKPFSSYKNFQGLDLSKILKRCNAFKYYSDIPVGGLSNLQKILIALAPHNTSAFDFYSTVYSKTIVPKQHVIDKPSLSTVDAIADAQIITPIATSAPSQISQQPISPSTHGENNQSKETSKHPEPQPTSTTPAIPTTLAEQQKPELLQPTPSVIETPQAPVTNKQHRPEPTPEKQQSKVTDAPKYKEEKVASTSFYKQLFLGLGSVGTFLLALYCYKHCDKESLINFFNDPQYALACLRGIVSKMAT